jgi:GDP-4-dehydro-6-deoxy-D-mannose reductase
MHGAVLVTGARGFVGRHLLAELGERGRPSEVDVTDSAAVARELAAIRPDAVVHLAARSSVAGSWESAAEVWHVNVLGTVNVLEGVREEAAGARVLAVSSAEVYGAAAETPTPEDAPLAPLSPYAASKEAAEVACGHAARAYRLDVVVARAFPHIGPGQEERFAVGSWTRQVARLEREGGGVLRVGDLTVRRDLLDVRDVCRAYRLLLGPDVPAGTYNVAAGRTTELARVVELLVELARAPIEVEPDEARFRAADIPVLCGDGARLAAATGWSPGIPLERTLADALDAARRIVEEEGHD